MSYIVLLPIFTYKMSIKMTWINWRNTIKKVKRSYQGHMVNVCIILMINEPIYSILNCSIPCITKESYKTYPPKKKSHRKKQLDGKYCKCIHHIAFKKLTCIMKSSNCSGPWEPQRFKFPQQVHIYFHGRNFCCTMKSVGG